jgi:hypothetical protein
LSESTLFVVSDFPQIVGELAEYMAQDSSCVFSWDEEDKFEASKSHGMMVACEEEHRVLSIAWETIPGNLPRHIH